MIGGYYVICVLSDKWVMAVFKWSLMRDKFWVVITLCTWINFMNCRGEGDTDKNSNSTKGSPDSHKSRESSSSNNIADTSPSSSSSTPDLTSKSSGLHSSSHKVERRESARLASGASKFLRSLRSGGNKESKDQVNVIALKELDSDHCLSPEGHGRPTTNGRLPERSQSFQEKRLLIPLPSSKVTPSGGGGGKGRHGRAQSFVCAQQPPQQLLHLKHQRHQQQLAHLNYLARRGGSGLSPPQGINGLPPAPPRPLNTNGSSGAAKGCDTIYENLEVILEQNNLNKESVHKRRRGVEQSNQQRTYVNVDQLVQIRKDQQQPQQQQDGTNNSRKLRRSISEVPSDRMVAFPKKTPTTPTHGIPSAGNVISPSKSQVNPIYSNG